MKRTVSMVVSFDLPDDASRTAACEYVLDAVASWAGSLRPPGSLDDNDPGDPMFGLKRDSITIAKVIVKRYEGVR